MTFIKGDIVLPVIRTSDKNLLYHPAIVWDAKTVDNSDFTGIMITGSEPKNGRTHIPLDAEHFVTGYKIPRKKSYFVNQLFIKFASWGPFEKVGELTEEGKNYIELKISDNSRIPFDANAIY